MITVERMRAIARYLCCGAIWVETLPFRFNVLAKVNFLVELSCCWSSQNNKHQLWWDLAKYEARETSEINRQSCFFFIAHYAHTYSNLTYSLHSSSIEGSAIFKQLLLNLKTSSLQHHTDAAGCKSWMKKGVMCKNLFLCLTLIHCNILPLCDHLIHRIASAVNFQEF